MLRPTSLLTTTKLIYHSGLPRQILSAWPGQIVSNVSFCSFWCPSTHATQLRLLVIGGDVALQLQLYNVWDGSLSPIPPIPFGPPRRAPFPATPPRLSPRRGDETIQKEIAVCKYTQSPIVALHRPARARPCTVRSGIWDERHKYSPPARQIRSGGIVAKPAPAPFPRLLQSVGRSWWRLGGDDGEERRDEKRKPPVVWLTAARHRDKNIDIRRMEARSAAALNGLPIMIGRFHARKGRSRSKKGGELAGP